MIAMILHFQNQISIQHKEIARSSFFQFVTVLDPKYPEILELLKEFRVVLDAKTAEDTYNPR